MEEFGSGRSANPQNAKNGGANADLTYACGAMKVCKQGIRKFISTVYFHTSELHYEYVRGTPALSSAPSEYPIAV